MKIIERRVLRGPNLHSHEPCFMAVLDLEGLDEVSPSGLPGFSAALLPGGFVERLREGACMAHVVEQVAIALQNLVGHDVGFGKSCRVRGSPRHHRVVVAYRNERVASAAVGIAVDLAVRLASGAPCDIGGSLAELRALAVSEAVGLSTRAIVEAARRRSIPTLRLTDDANLFQLGWGARQRHIEATTTSRTSAIAVNTASDKALTKALLAEAGLPVPAGRTVTTVQDAQAAARELGRPVVVKPLDANQGKGVSAAVTGDEATAAAFERAAAFGPNVIVEAHVEGDDYRVLIVAGEVVAAARRLPPRVVGDGGSSVRELVERENAHPARGNGHENMLTKIPLDAGAAQALALQGLDGDSVPEHGCVVHLR